MASKSYALAQARGLLYESPEAEWIALAVARGEIPPPESRTLEQALAVEAYLDGGFPKAADLWFVKETDCGHGHREGVAYKRTVDPWRRVFERLFTVRADRGEGDRAASIDRATRRAKTRVRLLCKSLGVTSLGTLTYQENMQDRGQVRRHFTEWLRRVRLVYPEFAYVACVEPQARGSLHIHFGMRKLPLWFTVPTSRGVQPVRSWDYLRRLWRSVIGGGGNFDESSTLHRAQKTAAARVAFYIAKYVGKEFATGALNARRFWASVCTTPPVVSHARFAVAELRDLIGLLFSGVSGELLDLSTSVAASREMFWLSAYSGEPGS